MKLWGMEPAIIIGAITSIVALLAVFGVELSAVRQERIKDAATAILPLVSAWLIRRQVIPVAKVEVAHGPAGVRKAEAVRKREIRT